MQRNSSRSAPRRARTLACAAVAIPALLVAGCSSDSEGEKSSASSPAAGSEQKPSPAPVKYKKLPDACKTLSKDTAQELTPKTDNAGGKRIGTGDTNDSGSCLWSGLDKYDYRQLTVSLKRFDSDTSRGSGDKLAKDFLDQQVKDVKEDKDNDKVKASEARKLGDEASSVSFDREKKGKKDGKDTFREQRTVVRSGNVVVTVDYEGTGFEDSDLPKADTLEEKAQKAAGEAVKSLAK